MLLLLSGPDPVVDTPTGGVPPRRPPIQRPAPPPDDDADWLIPLLRQRLRL